MWFNRMVFIRGLETHQNAILLMLFFYLFFFHLWNVAFVVTLLRFYPWPCATSLRDWNRNKSRAFSWNVLIYLANLLSLWTKFTQYFPLSGALKKNASQAFKFDGFMCHGYIFSPLLKLLSCLAHGRTDINVGVIRPQIEIVSKPFETTGKYRSKQKKSSFQWRPRDLLSKFHGRNNRMWKLSC